MKEIKRHLKKPIALIVALVMLVTMIPFISAPVHAETEITDVYLLFDEYDFTKFRLGYLERDADSQFRDLAEIRPEDKDKYVLNTYLQYKLGDSFNGIGDGEDPISSYGEYYLLYVVSTKPGYMFSSNQNDMNFYINGVKIIPYEVSFHKLNDGNTRYRIYVPAGPVIPRYMPRPQRNVRVKLYGHDDIHVSWDAQTVEGTEVKYIVEYKRPSWDYYQLVTYNITNNYCKKANVTDGAKYIFRVTPYTEPEGDYYMGESGYSRYIYTLKKIAAPRVSKSSRNYVRLRWTNIPGETGYEIARSRYKTKKFSTVKRVSYKYSTTRIKTPRNRTYYYKIRAYRTVDGKRIYAPWSAVRAYRLR